MNLFISEFSRTSAANKPLDHRTGGTTELFEFVLPNKIR